MKILKIIYNNFICFIDIFFSIFLIPASLIMLLYRKSGSHKLPISKNILNTIGIFPITNNFYEPKFDFSKLKKFSKNRNLPGIDLNLTQQITNLSKLTYTKELIKLKLKSNSQYGFNLRNSFFERGDAEIYYQIIRYFKPKNILEIGSGYSTLIALEAIKKNEEEGIKSKITCIEPYRNKWLESLNIKVLRKKVEDVEKIYFKLKSGDILFIDSSHIIKPQGDILKIYLEILPRLKKGVIVHIHDIFTPKDYPEDWIVRQNKFWNEQYLVEIIMMNRERYEIYLMLNYLKNNAYYKLKKICPYLNHDCEPGSLYLKIK